VGASSARGLRGIADHRHHNGYQLKDLAERSDFVAQQDFLISGACDFQVRDHRNGKWAWIHDAVVADPHLTDADVRCYLALASFANCPEIRPSVSKLARRASLHERTVRRCVSHLAEVGYVRVRRGGGDRPNIYDLLKATGGCLLCRRENVSTPLRPLAHSAPLTESTPLPENTATPGKNSPLPLTQSADEQNKEQNKEHYNPQQRNGKEDDRQAFIKEIAERNNLKPQRVQWRMERIALKATGPVRKLAYFRAAFPDFIKREYFELTDHLTQFGADLSRQNPGWGILDLTEEIKCEAARNGFTDYSDAVSMAITNLRRGVRDSRS
jgi:hypothetical protein